MKITIVIMKNQIFVHFTTKKASTMAIHPLLLDHTMALTRKTQWIQHVHRYMQQEPHRLKGQVNGIIT